MASKFSLTRRFATVAIAASALTLSAGASAHPDKKRGPGLVPETHSVMMVFANAAPGKEAEFKTWYNKHASDITKLEGYVRSQRFYKQSRAGRPDPAYEYVIMYEFVGEPDVVTARIGQAVKEGKVDAPDRSLVTKLESMAYKADQAGFAH